jgi:hypothetical protein
MSLKHTQFLFKQFAKRIGQANYNAFNQWKKEWVAGYGKKKNQSIIQGRTI